MPGVPPNAIGFLKKLGRNVLGRNKKKDKKKADETGSSVETSKPTDATAAVIANAATGPVQPTPETDVRPASDAASHPVPDNVASTPCDAHGSATPPAASPAEVISNPSPEAVSADEVPNHAPVVLAAIVPDPAPAADVEASTEASKPEELKVEDAPPAVTTSPEVHQGQATESSSPPDSNPAPAVS